MRAIILPPDPTSRALASPGIANELVAIDRSVNKNNHWHAIYSHHGHFQRCQESFAPAASSICPCFSARLCCVPYNRGDMVRVIHQAYLMHERNEPRLHGTAAGYLFGFRCVKSVVSWKLLQWHSSESPKTNRAPAEMFFISRWLLKTHGSLRSLEPIFTSWQQVNEY